MTSPVPLIFVSNKTVDWEVYYRLVAEKMYEEKQQFETKTEYSRQVFMEQLTDEEIEKYIAKSKPFLINYINEIIVKKNNKYIVTLANGITKLAYCCR